MAERDATNYNHGAAEATKTYNQGVRAHKRGGDGVFKRRHSSEELEVPQDSRF
jgi:hypothetical protein